MLTSFDYKFYDLKLINLGTVPINLTIFALHFEIDLVFFLLYIQHF